MKIVIGYDGSMRSRAAAAMLREQGHIVSAAYVTASSELPAELESKAASDGLFITAVYGDDSTTEGVISALCGHMKAYGFGAAATGHIARVSRDEKVTVDGENGEKQTVIKPCGAPRIAIAVDVPSDESAKLGLLSAETVAKLVLPLGELGSRRARGVCQGALHTCGCSARRCTGAHRLGRLVPAYGTCISARRSARSHARRRNAPLSSACQGRRCRGCRVAYLYSSACRLWNGRRCYLYHRSELCRGRRACRCLRQ